MTPRGVTRTIEPGLTLFSAAEIRVVRCRPHPGPQRRTLPTHPPADRHRLLQVLLPVGEAPDAVFQRYASLIMRHRQVELNNVRSFYKEAQKSPFKFFPWKQGHMHFRFLSVGPLSALQAPTEALAERAAQGPVHSVWGMIPLSDRRRRRHEPPQHWSTPPI